MSAAYRAVQWTRYKRFYDISAAGLILLFLATFILAGKLVRRGDHAISDEILVMRALGTCAFVLLTLILCIGPLCRIDRRFLPLLYNRRHLGVMTFFVALAHASIAVGFYHGFGRISPFASLLTSSAQYRSISAFPFEILGLLGLIVLFVMAATSHDFWLKNLSPRVWKSLHMLVYPAWCVLVLHIALGALQSERSPIYLILLAAATIAVPTVHLIAGRRETRRDRGGPRSEWIDVGEIDQIPQNRAKVVCVKGQERIAVFRHGAKFSALSNVCAHQSGPLGEGKIIDGCVTCPWHGYQYRPEDGSSPPPFTEKVQTFAVRVERGRVYVSSEPRGGS